MVEDVCMREEEYEVGMDFEIPLLTEQIEIDQLYTHEDRNRIMLTEQTPRRNADDILFDQLSPSLADAEMDYAVDDLIAEESLLD